jgi:hypothetical protein
MVDEVCNYFTLLIEDMFELLESVVEFILGDV